MHGLNVQIYVWNMRENITSFLSEMRGLLNYPVKNDKSGRQLLNVHKRRLIAIFSIHFSLGMHYVVYLSLLSSINLVC